MFIHNIIIMVISTYVTVIFRYLENLCIIITMADLGGFSAFSKNTKTLYVSAWNTLSLNEKNTISVIQ